MKPTPPLLLLLPLLSAACGGTPAVPFAASSPASSTAPDGQRGPVASVLDATDPGQASRSPLLTAPTAAPAVDHSHHHHGSAAPTTVPTAAPAMDHSHHQHGPAAGGSKP